MKCVLLFLLCVYNLDGFRVRRQVSGNFWWENIDRDAPSNDAEANVEDTIKEGDISNSPTDRRHDTNSGTEAIDNTSFSPSYEQCLGKNRVCVPYTHCSNGKIITDGFGILTTRSGVQLKQHSECPLYLEVCCEEPDLDGQFGGTVDSIHSGSEPKCGQRNYEGLGANIGRLNATFSQFAEFPWMAAVLKKESIAGRDFKLYMCGGSVISSNIILTAAHCVSTHRPRNIIVRVGEWDTQQKYEPFEYQERAASKIIQHPNFNPSTLAYDFSLIILKEPILYEPHVAPICLPNVNDVFDGQVCFATGWGKEQFGEKGTYQNVLKNVDLEVVPRTDCEAALKRTRLGDYFELHNTFTCAGGQPGKDTCGGDGGSPLVCKKTDNRGSSYYQAGIVAWGIGCGENGVPGVYADVREAIDWMHAEMAPYKL